jgi:hypothetical protein
MRIGRALFNETGTGDHRGRSISSVIVHRTDFAVKSHSRVWLWPIPVVASFDLATPIAYIRD